MNNTFEIEFLDHVAIRVKDMEISQRWYHEILGLQKLTFVEWGDYPVFMVKGNFGVALFPADLEDTPLPNSKNVKIDHFAFRVTRENFIRAEDFFRNKKVDYFYQDHTYFESIYLYDPDKHIVELTTETGKLKINP